MSLLLNKYNELCEGYLNDPTNFYGPDVVDFNKDTEDEITSEFNDELQCEDDVTCGVEFTSEPFSKKNFKQFKNFINKYANKVSEIPFSKLITDLDYIANDIEWMYKYKDEQWALDFVDALNEMSVSL